MTDTIHRVIEISIFAAIATILEYWVKQVVDAVFQYIVCTSRKILLQTVKMIFSAKKISPVFHSSSHSSSPVIIDSRSQWS